MTEPDLNWRQRSFIWLAGAGMVLAMLVLFALSLLYAVKAMLE